MLLRDDTATIPYTSHFGDCWEGCRFDEMSYTCLYEYINTQLFTVQIMINEQTLLFFSSCF